MVEKETLTPQKPRIPTVTKATPFLSSAFWVDVESSWDRVVKGETSGSCVIRPSVPEDVQLWSIVLIGPAWRVKGLIIQILGATPAKQGWKCLCCRVWDFAPGHMHNQGDGKPLL